MDATTKLMGRLGRLYRTSIGAKSVMAVTGLGLFLFLIAHLSGNLLVFKGRDAMNDYGVWLRSLGPFFWVLRIGLIAVFVVHIATAMRLVKRNREARPVPYAHEATVQATWASRHMLLTGLVVAGYLLYHLAHFTWEIVHVEHSLDAMGRHDVYGNVVASFSHGGIAVLYVALNLVLGVHLIHGTRSLFQSLGIEHAALNPLVRLVAPALTILVIGGNCFIPLAVLFGIVQ